MDNSFEAYQQNIQQWEIKNEVQEEQKLTGQQLEQNLARQQQSQQKAMEQNLEAGRVVATGITQVPLPKFRVLSKEQYEQKSKISKWNYNRKVKAYEKSLLRFQQEQKNSMAQQFQEAKARQEATKESKKSSLLTSENEERTKELDKQWEKGGGASYHATYEAKEAEELVKKSNGFLCAKQHPQLAGVKELRPSLPETVVLQTTRNGKKVAVPVSFRRNYNLFLKAYARTLMDKEGKLKEDASQKASELSYRAQRLGFSQEPEDSIGVYIDTYLRPELEAIFREKGMKGKALDQELNKVCTEMKLQFERPVGKEERFILPPEIMEATERFVDKKQKFEEKTQAQWLEEVKSKYKEENQGAEPSDEQIKKWQQQIQSMSADLVGATKEFQNVCNMDENDEEVPIPNACSANGRFVQNIQYTYQNREQPFNAYYAENYFQGKEREIVDTILEHLKDYIALAKPDEISMATGMAVKKSLEPAMEKIREDLLEMKAYMEKKKEPGESETFRTEKDRELFTKYGKLFTKYEYHVAANIIKEDDRVITTEGFAPETSDLTVSPFTLHSVVGDYKGTIREENNMGGKVYRSPGMVDFYNQDNPFASQEAIDKIDLMVKMGLK